MDISLLLENQIKFTNPVDYFNLNISLCLRQGIVKQTPTAVLCMLAMEIMDHGYGNNGSLITFTLNLTG